MPFGIIACALMLFTWTTFLETAVFIWKYNCGIDKPKTIASLGITECSTWLAYDALTICEEVEAEPAVDNDATGWFCCTRLKNIIAEQKPETTTDTRSEKPLVFWPKTLNQMLKNGKTANRHIYQNRQTEAFRCKNRKTDLKNYQNRETENPTPPSLLVSDFIECNFSNTFAKG